MSEEKEALRKLIMLISDLRAKDEERYEAHVNFMNETIKMIRAIENQMNKHWATVLESLKELNENINSNLDLLLTGINPKGLRETSQSLKEIMDTMNKSVQSMNLEKVLSELKTLKTTGVLPLATSTQIGTSKPEPITAGAGLKPPGLATPVATTNTEEQIPEHYEFGARKEEDDDEDVHLLKPSDFFGS
ncbi:MAG: hypothetical protein ACTSQJ_11625 [Promethearchaeota archaeon]